jgi:hypothetical protein
MTQRRACPVQRSELRWLRTNEGLPDATLLDLLTAAGNVGAKAELLGTSGYLQKPLKSIAIVLDEVERVVARAS